ncbi:hypothetical protein [Companilactobacillus sp. DQM5]|uniref:hypothetical protein n=1 Tax=Companilactobacillus sp. DQM5 TaxID=3463359 RepID=UPI004059DF6F
MTRNLHTGISGRRRPKKNGLDRVKHAADVLAFLKGREDNVATAPKKSTAKKTTTKKTTKKAEDK